MSDLQITHKPTATPLADDARAKLLQDPRFGQVFTDHMVSVRWEAGRGWHDAELVPYGPVALDPATSVLHYGQAIFEGFKAYRQPDGGIATFRPDANARRFAASAARLAMPQMPADLFVATADALIQTDRAWVPDNDGESLYLRPLLVATEVGLGVRPASEYLYLLLASPAGAYFPRGVRPVTVWLCDEYARAAPGGTGAAKFAGNYAASLLAQAEAAEHGCDQVVWLDAVEHRRVEEMGGMNLAFVIDGALVTPALTGTLLAGITRDSLLVLAAEVGMHVVEREVTRQEWQERALDGSLSEAFACGTAAVITPIGRVKHRGGEFVVADGEPGPVTTSLRRTLLDIQHGRVPDRHGWLHPVC